MTKKGVQKCRARLWELRGIVTHSIIAAYAAYHNQRGLAEGFNCPWSQHICGFDPVYLRGGQDTRSDGVC